MYSLVRSWRRVITTDASFGIVLFLNNIGKFNRTKIGYEKSDVIFMDLWDMAFTVTFLDFKSINKFLWDSEQQ